ncbi:MAG: hypothetical protein DMG80_03260 [Acidobacteria bacterium]|nr:MAG: hypothetical protein DMG80_03260 [Acidobacteriota bacterium]
MLQTPAKRPARPIPAPTSRVKQYICEIVRPGQPFRKNEVISRRVLALAAVMLSRFQTPAIAAQESVTPDQIIARYLHAIGAEQIPSVTTFVERGEIQNKITNPNLTNPGRLSVPPPDLPQRGRYESYFKSPNLRFNSTISENNLVMGVRGCDGKVAWYIDNSLKRQEFTPKPGQEYECENGFTLSPLQRDEHTKIRLAGKMKMEGRVAWEIKVENPKSHSRDTYYFDTETYLLLRYKGQNHSVTLSDYREVSGIKKPFTIVRENDYFRTTITVREVQVNVPIDNSRFVEPQPINGSISLDPVFPRAMGENRTATPPAPKAPEPVGSAPAAQINYPNFSTCTVAELQALVPDLRQLKPAADQTELQPLLEKIGARLLDTARNTPNLIARESVTNSAKSVSGGHREYDYLIVPRLEGAEINLNEFRVDLKTGDKFQADDVKPNSPEAGQAAPVETIRQGQQPTASETGRQPLSQGFATSWVYFFPHNQEQSAFRYLGEQKLDGRRSVVLAFAQKPQAVRLPGLFRYQGKSVPLYFQGVAWFDPSDFRILRIRTELLSPVPEVSLQQLSADIQFVETRISGVSSILFLPHDVDVISAVGGGTLREHHSYSNYRLFRAQSRILADP